MSAGRPPWARFREALDRRGFRPSRRLGQNFLLDDNAARAIARDAGVEPGDFVLEVGPGCGFLSVHLAERGARLLAVEIDPRLASIAREFLAPFPDARVVVGDVLAGKHALAPEVAAELPRDEPWRVVSNLPYSVSGPFVAVVARLPHPPESVTVLVQREVADRLTAAPGEPAWGALSARVRWSYRAEAGRRVGAWLFWPRPKVESAVVHLRRRPERPAPEETASFDRAVRAVFRARRKTLRKGLATALGSLATADAALAEVGLDGGRRPDTLTLEELARLGAASAFRSSAP